MPIVVNEGLAGQAVHVLDGPVVFSEDGQAEVTEDQATLLVTLQGYRLAEAPKPAARRGRPPKEKAEE